MPTCTMMFCSMNRHNAPLVRDEYTDECLNAQYYQRTPIRMSSERGCKAYVRTGYARLSRSKYKDANWME